MEAVTTMFAHAIASPREGSDVTDDGILVVRALAGDRAATDALFRAHAAAVLGVVTRLIGRRQDAEDVAQDAFAVALSELADLRDLAAFGPWLRTIAVRQAHRYFRRRRVLRVLGLDRGVDDATLALLATPTASPDVRASLRQIDEVLATVPYEHRIAWCLRCIEGDALDDVASACGCSLATAKRWIASVQTRIDARTAPGGEP